jgi:hypothetical protein
MDSPVGKAGERRRGDRPRQRVGAAHRPPARQERRTKAHDGQQGTGQARLRQRAQLNAVWIARRLLAATVEQILLGEVVGADAEQRMGDEFV